MRGNGLALSTTQSMPLGIVLERRRIDHPWQEFDWRVVAVLPGAPEAEGWRMIGEGEGWTRFHAATLALEIHRKETEAYQYNLLNDPPAVYVLLREDDEEDAPYDIAPALATVSPYEAQDWLDGDEHLVETVPMPELIRSWLAAYVDEHHVEEPRYKRKRKGLDPEPEGRRRFAGKAGGGGP